jgi:predicted esterase
MAEEALHDPKESRFLELYCANGATTAFSARVDARFSYVLYVPRRLRRMGKAQTTILVCMHGAGRDNVRSRDQFGEFAEYYNCIVLAPLFPARVRGDDNLNGYKYLIEGDIRYDNVLLALLDEVRAFYGIASPRILLFGFSAGAQFAHRFALLHPETIRAVSIGAPGTVTLLGTGRSWWAGTAGIESIFGITLNEHDIQGMPVHLVVGDADLETLRITFAPGDRDYVPGANDAGRDRIERARALADSFRKHGASVRFDFLADTGHDMIAAARSAREFFADVLEDRLSDPPATQVSLS